MHSFFIPELTRQQYLKIEKIICLGNQMLFYTVLVISLSQGLFVLVQSITTDLYRLSVFVCGFYVVVVTQFTAYVGYGEFMKACSNFNLNLELYWHQ